MDIVNSWNCGRAANYRFRFLQSNGVWSEWTHFGFARLSSMMERTLPLLTLLNSGVIPKVEWEIEK